MSKRVDGVVVAVLTSYGANEGKIVPEAKLRTDLGMDSLDMMQIGSTLGIVLTDTIPDETVQAWKTVKDLCDFVAGKLA